MSCDRPHLNTGNGFGRVRAVTAKRTPPMPKAKQTAEKTIMYREGRDCEVTERGFLDFPDLE